MQLMFHVPKSKYSLHKYSVSIPTFARLFVGGAWKSDDRTNVPEIPSFPTERPRVLSTNDAQVQRKFNSNKLCINGGSEVQIPFFNIPVVIFIVALCISPSRWLDKRLKLTQLVISIGTDPVDPLALHANLSTTTGCQCHRTVGYQFKYEIQLWWMMGLLTIPFENLAKWTQNTHEGVSYFPSLFRNYIHHRING